MAKVLFTKYLPCLLFSSVAVTAFGVASLQALAEAERPSPLSLRDHRLASLEAQSLLDTLEAPCSRNPELRETFYRLDPVSRLKLAQKLSQRHKRDLRDYLSSCLVSPREDYRSVHDDILIYAASHGLLQVVTFLIEEKGADARVHTDLALRFAAQAGHLPVVKYLVNQGCDPHAADDTASIWSKANQHHDVYQYLQTLNTRRPLASAGG